ncbi:MAG: neutral/alkaline non-lysosomal ceramidase N-terminal domain-containing protein, partial [Planctomycetes bacterium]|nr:neutral/alkaline non-lysosomal ceramidase N-terminal domain-containing protein [Planctomycetota bacterium]
MVRNALLFTLTICVCWASAKAELRVGFGEADITPDVKGARPVWLAGYGTGRRATGVHDPLMARCVVLKHAGQKIALVSVDLVGLQYPETLKVRDKLRDFRYVVVSSTHNHEGPDVVGIWGRSPIQRGVDEAYLRLVVDRIVGAVKEADKSAVAATARYGTAQDESLLGDSRLPKVYDGVLRAIRFTRTSDKQTCGILVQWNCHPEAMGSKNTLVTADFPYATVDALKKRFRCPVAYFTGAVGGLMAPPDGKIKDDAGKVLQEGDFEFARVYGQQVAELAVRAIEAAEPIRLTPISVSARSIQLPVKNQYYRLSHALRILRRDAYVWTGDYEKRGDPLTPENAKTSTMAVATEVGYLRLGELDVACVPGEIYPELVYGKDQ